MFLRQPLVKTTASTPSAMRHQQILSTQTPSSPIPRVEFKINFKRLAKRPPEVLSQHDFAGVPAFPKSDSLLPYAATLL